MGIVNKKLLRKIGMFVFIIFSVFILISCSEGERGPQGADGIPGKDGVSITQVVINDSNELVITFSDLTSINLGVIFGSNETGGVDGKSVLLQVSDGYIQWQQVGDTEWNNLIEISSLVGLQGEKGVGIKTTEINSEGELIITFDDDTVQNLGKIIRSYTVSFIDHNGYLLNVQNVFHGFDAIQPTDPLREGFTFSGWSTDYTNVKENIDVYAIYTINNYDITFDSNGAGVVDSMIGIQYGTSVSLPTPIREGYYFAGWYLDDTINGEHFTNSSPVTSNIMLYARWELQPFKVNFYEEDGTLIKSQEALYGSEVYFSYIPTKEGYSFSGWNENITNIISNLDVYPTFTAKNDTQYKINYYQQDLYDDGYELYESVQLEGTTDELIALTISPNHYFGFTFNESHQNNVLESVILPDGTSILSVYFDRNIFNVTYYDYDDNVIEMEYVRFKASGTFPTPPNKKGYTFDMWSNSVDEVMDHINSHAIYQPNAYQITFDVNGGEYLDNDTKTVVYDSIIGSLIAPIRTGYTFSHWQDSNEKIYSSTDHYTEDKDIILYAFWLANDAEYTVNHYKENLDGSYSLFEFETIEAVTDLLVNVNIKNYTGFILNQSHESNILLGTVTNDNSLILNVYYQREVYTVTFVDYDETIIDVETVKYLGTANIPSDPERIGYTFLKWNQITNNITQNLIVTALYDINLYTVSFNVDGGEEISSVELEYLDTYSLPSTTKNDYIFMGWYFDGQTYFDETIIIDKDYSFIAQWKLIENYRISFDTQGGNAINDYVVLTHDVITILPMPNKTDFTFVGWAYQDNILELPFLYSFDEDITLVAIWMGLSEDISYEINNDEVTILSYHGNDSNLILPDTIAGYPITTIGEEAFKNNAIVQTIILGQYVTTIEKQAFYGMTNLRRVEFASSTVLFGSEVLYGSNNLESIILSSQASYQLRYYFGNNINFIPTSLQTLEFNTKSLLINDTIFKNNLRNVKSVILLDGVESIPNNLFEGMNTVQNITIPNSVTSIGQFALQGTSGLESISLPFIGESRTSIGTNGRFGYIFGNSSYTGSYSANGYYIPNNLKEVIVTDATNIESNAFYGINSLINIELPNSVTSIGASAFRGASSLTSIIIPNSVTIIGDYVFYGASSLTGIEVPNNVTSIGNYAFYDASSLTSIEIPNSVTSIGNYAFQNSGLGFILFEEGSQLTSIGNYAFSGASNLTSIDIPNSVTSIGAGALRGASSLESISLPFIGQNRTATGTSGYFGYIFGTGNYTGSYSANGYYIPNNLKEIIVTDATRMEATALAEVSSLESLTIPFVGESRTATGINGRFYYVFGTNNYEGSYNVSGRYLPISLKEVTITDTINIGDYAFYGTSNLTNIEIPNGVTSIGTGAFHGTSNLTGIKIPKSVTNIGNNAFQNSGLEVIIFEEGSQLTSIGSYAFSGVSNLTIIEIPNSVTNIGTYAFQNSNLEVVLFEEGSQLTIISSFAFSGTSKLTSIEIPNSVTNIDVSAFLNSSLEVVLFEEGSQLTIIESSAFSGVSNLTSIEIPNSVTNIGTSAFSGTSNLESITLPFIGESRTATGTNGRFGYIFGTSNYEGSYSASGGRLPISLKEIIVTDTTNVVNNAFSGATNVISIVIPTGVTNIGTSAFSDTINLTSIEIPNSVTSIGANAFNGASSLESIFIPNSVNSIGASAFSETDRLVIYVESSSKPNNWNINWVDAEQTVIWGYTETLTLNGIVYALSINQTAYIIGILEGNVNSNLYIPKYVNDHEVNGIASYAFEENEYIKTVFIPNSLLNIDRFAFYNAKNIVQISFETFSQLELIGSFAFYGTDSLTSIEIPNSVTSIGTSAFKNSGLEVVLFEKDSLITNIGNNVFSGTSKLTGIEIPNSVIGIGDYAFQNSGLKFVLFEESSQLISIGNHAFSRTSNLTSIAIPNSVTSIGTYAFQDSGLEVILFEEGSQLELIDSSAFSGASSLTSIEIPNSVISIGAYAFQNSGIEFVLFEEGSQLELIGSSAFYGASNLISIEIPSSVTIIGSSAFSGASSLTGIEISNNVTSIGSSAFSGASSLTSIEIPNSVISIGAYAFQNSGLEFILFEEGSQLTSIANYVFSGASSLTSIEIPNSVTSIGTYAFQNSGLEFILFEEGSQLTSIGNYAFSGASNLTSIEIPNSVTSIGTAVFRGVSSLEAISLPFIGQNRTATSTSGYFGYIFGTVSYTGSYSANGYYLPNNLKEVVITDATSITANAFNGASSLINIVISEGVRSIGTNAFFGTTSLMNITVHNNNQSYVSLDGVLFTKNKETLIKYPENKIGEYIVPDGVKYIGNAFYGAIGLTRLELPNSILRIDSGSFYGVKNLEYMTIPFAGWSRTASGSDSVLHFGYIFGKTEYEGSYNANGYYLPDTLKIVIVTDTTKLGNNAFSGASSLTSIVIPNKVTIIGSNAFSETNNLIIFTEATDVKPNWDANWNSDNNVVYWSDQWQYDEHGNPTPN